MPCRFPFMLDYLSGKTATVTARFHENVETLMCRAQTALGVGRGRLLDSRGSVLDAHGSIKDSGLQSGDSLILQICPVQACRAASAFATILIDGSVATWGKALLGGDCSAAQDKLAKCAADPSHSECVCCHSC